MTRLLIIGCSASKRPDPVPLLAGERYTGMFYRVIAKTRREGQWPSDLHVAIISAKYGFLLEESPGVECYDQKMDRKRALELQEEVGRTLDEFLQRVPCQEVFIALGAPYRLTLVRSLILEKLENEGNIHFCITSGIGKMLHQTKNWITK